ncbi:MAG: sulfurtransferase TusA family protein [Clostridiales bacterium]|nr:sulfurtransferase TusA family protein [Clostridiales bacterium]
MNHREVLKVKATDPAFREDIKAWCTGTGNTLVSLSEEKGTFTALIKK